jgi:DNA-binding CsgD family transcriptional regulator
LDGIGRGAFACDASGRVLAVSAAGESVLRAGKHLRLSGGRLRAVRAEDDRLLSDAVRKAAAPDVDDWGGPVRVSCAAGDGGRLTLDVGRYVPDLCGPRALVLVGSEPARDAPERLRKLGLTPTEVDVALALGGGASPAHIARERAVSLSTVRTQIKAVYGKLNVRRQNELAALLSGRSGA